jgi:hypothetical protein
VADREPDGHGQARRVIRQPLPRDRRARDVDLAEGVEDLDGDRESLLELSVEVDDAGRPSRDEDLVDLLGRGRGEKEVEGLLELLGQVVGDGPQDREDVLPTFPPS